LTYVNPENGYTVAKVQPSGKNCLVAVVGNLPSVQAGESVALTFVCRRMCHRRYPSVRFLQIAVGSIAVTNGQNLADTPPGRRVRLLVWRNSLKPGAEANAPVAYSQA
jgi:hypothetical protein